MAAGSWQEAATQQAEEAAARVRDVLSGGLGLLRAELGLELGLDPQGLPTWLALVVPAALGLGLLGLLLAVACGGGLRKKAARSAAERKGDETASVGLTAGGGHGKAVGLGPGQLHLKGDEQKKRNKKKLPEKTARVRGPARAAPLGREGVRAVGREKRLGPGASGEERMKGSLTEAGWGRRRRRGLLWHPAGHGESPRGKAGRRSRVASRPSVAALSLGRVPGAPCSVKGPPVR